MLSSRVSLKSSFPAAYSANRVVASRRPQPVQALFGFGKSREEVEAEKEEAYQAQLELLRERREGKLIKKAEQRREGVKTYLKEERAAREKAYREGKNVELPGKPKIKTKDQYGTDSNSGIVIPMIPIGIPKYDNGERFDLKAPYADKGYVDPEDNGGFSLARLFGKGKKK